MLVTLTRAITSWKRLTGSHVLPLLVTINLLLPLFFEVNIVTCSRLGSDEQDPPPSTNTDENDFAEFAEFDDDEDHVPPVQPPGQPQSTPVSSSLPGEKQQASTNEKSKQPSSSRETSDEDNEESIVEDIDEEEPDEEEMFESIAQPNKVEDKKKRKWTKSNEGGDLKITNIPAHLRNNWDAYYMEIIMALGIFAYFVNFIAGRNKNESLANAWLETNRQTIESNFSLIGDDGKKEIENYGLVKDTENTFYLWCSGRVGMEGMLVEIRLWRRHDLVSVIAKLLKPTTDQVTLRFCLNSDSMDNFVFCLATKRSAARLVKEYTDISTFCPERRAVDKIGLNIDKLVMMNEIGEVPTGVMDQKIIATIKQFEDLIDYIHISDQYSGPKLSEYEQSSSLKMPDVKKIAIFSLNMSPLRGRTTIDRIEEQRPLLQMVLYFVDRVRKFRLSKEGKSKSDKNRQKVEESFLKATHAQQQEAAQLKREERRRLEKERILNEDDPEKQRKWEEREYRREMKKKIPKMKQLKVKAM